MGSGEVVTRGVRLPGGILDRIVEKRSQSLAEVKKSLPPGRLIELCAGSEGHRPSFKEAIGRGDRTNIIAEVKRQSPSKGILRTDFDHRAIARSYEAGGAAAISVLTEEDFFGGSLRYLTDISECVRLPLLRKDFVIDEYQIYEAKLAGASAVLLITALLDDELLRPLLERCHDLGLDVLVEVHDEEEMRRALLAGAEIIGVNNRDLTSFTVDLETSIRLAPLAPAGVTMISESGIRSGEDIRRLRRSGYQAFLVGEQIMRELDTKAAVEMLLKGAG
jgi:indole-3-glycerol phosphate synthase